jgi:hypothetical protein
MLLSILVPPMLSVFKIVSAQSAQHPLSGIDPAQFDNHFNEPGMIVNEQ